MRALFKAGIMLAAMVWSAGAAASDPAGATCRDAILGRLCTLTSQANPASIYGQYGYVEIRAIPPASIDRAIKRTLRKRPDDVIKRLFQDKTVAGVVTLKIVLVDGDKEVPIGIIPISNFSTSDKGGITISNTSLTTAGERYFRATPYFKLDQNRYSIKAYIAIHTTTNVNSNIAKFASGALSVVAPFMGTPGAVVSSLTEPAVVKKISDFEALLFGEQRSMDPNELVQLAFTSDNALEYRYELDPKAAARSGFIAARLRAVPSLFSETVDTHGKPVFDVAKVGIPVRANQILTYSHSSSQTLGEALKSTAGATYWDEFRKPFTSEALYTPPCTTLRDASLSNALGLTAVDAKALFWAAYVTSVNGDNAKARATGCLRADATPEGGDDFKRYGLELSPLRADNTPDIDGEEPKPKPLPAAVLGKVEYKKFTEIVATALRLPQGTGDHATAKRALLGNLFNSKVGFVSPMDYDAFLPLDPSPVDQVKMIDVFAALALKNGCYYRLADQKTRFFGRVMGADGQASEILWHLTAATVSDGTASRTYITDLEVRPARTSDFTAAADVLANRPACLDPKRSPD